MGKLLIVSKAEQLNAHDELREQYNLAYEINDFFEPNILDDGERVEQTIATYMEHGIPDGSTMHGAFLDLALFSYDERVRNISMYRMRQSMEIARTLGVKAVIFHTNYNPMLSSPTYDGRVVDMTVKGLAQLLQVYYDIDIYLENMFDIHPDVLVQIAEKLREYNNFGVCFDYAHACVFGHNIDNWVSNIAPYTKHMHVNDNDLKVDLHMAIGDGAMDWTKFAQYYNDYFSHCPLLIETTLPLWQKRSLEYLKEKTDLIQ